MKLSLEKQRDSHLLQNYYVSIHHFHYRMFATNKILIWEYCWNIHDKIQYILWTLLVDKLHKLSLKTVSHMAKSVHSWRNTQRCVLSVQRSGFILENICNGNSLTSMNWFHSHHCQSQFRDRQTISGHLSSNRLSLLEMLKGS